MVDYGDLSLLEGIEIFFNAIKEKISTNEEYSAELLKARGFLLEDEGLFLSDNSHKYDEKYLDKLLTSENIGKVQDRKIIILPDANVEKIFYSSIHSGSGSFLARSKGWNEFLHSNYAPKVCVCLLEKFVARYVKAISACGIETHGSCDGNHHSEKDFSSIMVELSNYPEIVWHKIILEKLLNKKFKVLTRDQGANFGNFKLLFKKCEKWQAYIELNQVAEFLYNNRKKIRQIRREVSDEIILGKSRRMIEKMPNDELSKIFAEKANKLFDEHFKVF